MERNGWIKLHRNIENHWIWEKPKYFQQWVDMLFLASWDKKTVLFNNRPVSIDRGQFATSFRTLQSRWKTNGRTVKVFLETLEQDGMIKIKTTKLMTIVTICNYERYQSPQNNEKSTIENTSILEHEEIRERTQIIKNNNKINNISKSKHTREKEIEFQERIKVDEIAKEDSMRILHVDESECKELLDMFIAYVRLSEEPHRDYPHFRTHFVNWSKKHLSIEKENGTKQKPEATAEDRYAARRGVEPSAVKEKNFKSGF